MKFKIAIILLLVIGLITSACDKDKDLLTLSNYSSINAGNSSTYPLNGEYLVHLDTAIIVGNDTTWSIDPFQFLHQAIELYNTEANDGDSLWVDNTGSFSQFGVKCQIACNPSKLTFGSINSADINRKFDVNINDSTIVAGVKMPVPDTVSFKSGKLILNGGKSLLGIKTDSIAVFVIFKNTMPKTLFRMSGVRWTGFYADLGYTY